MVIVHYPMSATDNAPTHSGGALMRDRPDLPLSEYKYYPAVLAVSVMAAASVISVILMAFFNQWEIVLAVVYSLAASFYLGALFDLWINKDKRNGRR